MAILAHAIVKEAEEVADTEIDRAIQRKEMFEASPEVYTYLEGTENGEDK